MTETWQLQLIMKKESQSIQNKILSMVDESCATLHTLTRETPQIARAAQAMISCLRKKNKIVVFGNGGSAADAQHLAAELSGRFEKDRPGLPVVALTTNTSAITAIGNDYSYDQIFTRQMQGFVKKGDVAIAISTSGNSGCVLKAAKLAEEQGAAVIGWTGDKGGQLKKLVDICICVPATRTCRVQEGHLLVLHTLSSLVEQALFPDE